MGYRCTACARDWPTNYCPVCQATIEREEAVAAPEAPDPEEDTAAASLKQQIDTIRREAVGAKDKLTASIVAFVFIAFCIGVWVMPDLFSIERSEFTGRGGRRIARSLKFIWSRPVGSIAGLIGLLLAWGVCTRKIGEIPAGEEDRD